MSEATITETKTLPVYDIACDMKHFKFMLAEFCDSYVMEVARPIMQSADELFCDPAVVKLVELWYDANRRYHQARQQYLLQWSDYDPEDEFSLEPYEGYRWDDEKRKAFHDTLYALLVG